MSRNSVHKVAKRGCKLTEHTSGGHNRQSPRQRRRDQEDVFARSRADLAAGRDAQWFKMDQDGMYQFRILPPFGESRQFWQEYQKAFKVGPNSKIVTPLAQFGQDCPIQKRVDELNKLGDETSKKEAARIRPKQRTAMIVIDRKNEAKGPSVFETNNDVFKDILTLMSDPDYDNITHPEKGFDVVINYTKKGKNGFPEAVVHLKRNPSPLASTAQQLTDWLSCDWFEAFRVGQPSDAGYIQACLDGTESAYIESRRGQSQGGQSQGQESQHTTATTGYIAPPAPSGQPVVTHKFLAGTKLWQVLNGQVVETTVEQVCQHLKSEKAESVQLLAYDQAGGQSPAKRHLKGSVGPLGDGSDAAAERFGERSSHDRLDELSPRFPQKVFNLALDLRLL